MHRYVAAQPIIFQQNDKTTAATTAPDVTPLSSSVAAAKTRYNLRKLNQLPYHLAQAGRQLSLMQQVLFNYEWIHAKLTAVSVQKVISDYNLLTDHDDVALVSSLSIDLDHAL